MVHWWLMASSDGLASDRTDTAALSQAGATQLVRLHRVVRWHDHAGDHSATIARRTVVGSAAQADLVIDDRTVSRLHAELEPRDDGLWARDLSSRNGTVVDGVRVGLARIGDRSRVKLGAAELLFDDPPVETSVELSSEERFGPLLGRSPAMRELFAVLAKVAATDATVLITGETGTGKELVAQALHEASPRRSGPFVVVDCAALPETLLESELFGHAKGAFTGATTARVGALEAADGGTVFLDEIGELPLVMQPKLLRVLESRTVRPLGESAHRKVDTRFVCATHRDLPSMVNAGAFREDLYFRLAVVPIAVPPLRQRRDDIELLLRHFLPALDAGARARVLSEVAQRAWLGNVRELRNLAERVTALGAEHALALGEAPGLARAPSLSASPTAPTTDASTHAASFEKPFRDFRDDMEREYVRRLLERHGGNVRAASQAADLDRTYLHRLVRKYSL
jgi:two-component system response regulator GlrR